MTRPQANHLLDLVRAGGDVPESQILFALWAGWEGRMKKCVGGIVQVEVEHG